MNSVKKWLLANPVIEHFLEGIILAIVLAAYHYFETGTETGAHLTWQGLGLAVAVAGKIFLASNRATLIAWAQDYLESQKNGVPGGVALPVPAPSTAALTPIAKAILFALGLSLFAGSVSAQTVWKYGGGLNFGKETLTVATKGFYSFPVIGASASPVNFQNGEVYLAPQYGISLLYLFGDGTLTPGEGGFSFDTKGILPGIMAGDGAFQNAPDGGVQIAKGFLGVGAFAPSTFGNVGIGAANRLNEEFHPFVCVLFVQSFDIFGGFGLIHW